MCLAGWVVAWGQRRPQTPVVETTYSVPSAVAPGGTTEITFFNAPAGEPVGLWTSFAATVRFLGAEGGKVRCQIDVPADVPVGIAAVRLFTTGGASSLQLLMIDDLPSVRGAADNTAAKSAQIVSAGAAIDGACEAVSSDYFALAASKGQRISIEAVAQRIGSKMDPMIRLLDSAGRELAYCDDGPGAGADPRISHRFEADGQYLIEIRDANHEGGADYRYRLRIGDFPLAIAPFPLGAARGSNANLSIDTLDSDSIGPITVTIPAQGVRRSIGVKHRGGESSGFVSLICDDIDEVLASGNNTAAATAVPLVIPSATSGRFDKAGVRRFYAVSLRKGQRIVVRARTRSLGSPCDALIRLLTAEGSKVAQSTSTAAEDASLEFTAGADGQYHIVVDELARLAGPGMVFRLEIENSGADFEVSVETEKVNVAAGGTFRIKVTATRREFNGPITLSLAGDGGVSGFEVKNATIGKDKKETELEVRVPAGFSAGVVQFRILGRAKIGDAEVERIVSTLPALKLLFPRLAYPPGELDGLIGLGVKRVK
jgi:hypothetical protein